MLSPSSASKAEKLGYVNVKVFHDGMPAWKKAAKEVVSTAKFVKENIDKDIPQVIIDIRLKDEAMKGHLPGAVSMPAKDVGVAKERFPADKKAPIIIYSADYKDMLNAFNAVRSWGYSNAAILKGGIDAWVKEGYPLETDKLKAEIVYVPKPRPGEIAIEEFKTIAETLPADKLIVDVRDEDEAMHGMLRGAKNISAQDITKRLAEIPKDKEIIVHCVTGVRAEMAYLTLKEAGYKARFLNANIKIDKDGKYEVSKE